MTPERLKELKERSGAASTFERNIGFCGLGEDEAKEIFTELDRLLGEPFTCGHESQYAGGACAVCHVQWIERAQKADLQKSDLSKALWTAYHELKRFGHDVNGAVLDEVCIAIKRSGFSEKQNDAMGHPVESVADKLLLWEAKVKDLVCGIEAVLVDGHVSERGSKVLREAVDRTPQESREFLK